MRWFSVSLPILLIGIPLSARASDNSPVPGRCWDRAKTQLAMNKCAWEEYKDADASLNKAYQQLLTKYASEQVKLQNIKKAQTAWIEFRNAEVESFFPAGEPGQGSVVPMCRAILLKKITVQRTSALKQFLNHKEGDVCYAR